MAHDFARHDRVAGLLRRELATLIWREIKDPRLGPLNVTDVEVTPDLARARVFVASSDPESVPQSLEVLERASGFLRRVLGRRLSLRSVPELKFFHDDSLEQGAHIDELLGQALPPEET